MGRGVGAPQGRTGGGKLTASGPPNGDLPPDGDDFDYEIPAERLPAGFRDTLSRPVGEPVAPRPAATAVLLRENEEGPQVLLLRRNRATGFVPGAYVFPGGRVDEADGDPPLAGRWKGLTGATAQARLRLDPEVKPHAIAYYTAAVREAFEETGLLLASGVGDVLSAPGLATAREHLLMDSRSFADVLEDLGLFLDGSVIEYIAHWVTPSVEPRRYDTRFFAASVPAGAEAVHDEREMTDAVWLTPRRALARHRDGTLPMIFPTIRTLEDLVDFESVEELFRHYGGSKVPRIMPEIVRTEGGVGLRVRPDGPGA